MDDHCIVGHACIFECVQQSSNLVIQISDQSVVGGSSGTDLVLGVAAEVERLHQSIRSSGKIVELTRRIVRQVCVLRPVQGEVRLGHDEGEVRGNESDA